MLFPARLPWRARPGKQSPILRGDIVPRGDCFAALATLAALAALGAAARNDTQMLDSPRRTLYNLPNCE
ncbi:MAG: hypothetical protein FD146_242 [Anaerolineaceae bacterium]|nr:MAG: hypothetical protein FD146_242 [Anaerolineaceae bacterium]